MQFEYWVQVTQWYMGFVLVSFMCSALSTESDWRRWLRENTNEKTLHLKKKLYLKNIPQNVKSNFYHNLGIASFSLNFTPHLSLSPAPKSKFQTSNAQRSDYSPQYSVINFIALLQRKKKQWITIIDVLGNTIAVIIMKYINDQINTLYILNMCHCRMSISPLKTNKNPHIFAPSPQDKLPQNLATHETPLGAFTLFHFTGLPLLWIHNSDYQ